MSDTTPPHGLGDVRSPGGRVAGLAATIVLVGTTASLVFHYVCGAYLGLKYPWDTFLFAPWARFSDLYQPLIHARTLGPSGSGVIDYSPFATMLLTPVSALPDRVAFALLVVSFLVALVCVLRLATAEAGDGLTRVRHGFILGALSYPVLLVVERGNLEMLVFAGVAAFLYMTVVRGSRWSWVPLSLAIALKVYPATLLVLLLAERRYREAAFAAAAAVGLNVVAVLVLGPVSGFGVAGVVSRFLRSFAVARASGTGITWGGAQHGHSLWGALGLGWGLVGNPQTPTTLATAYAVLAAVIFVAVSAYVLMVERVAWKRAALLVMCFLLLPYSSHDYTLIHVLPLLALLVLARERSRYDKLYACLLALLLVPLDYWFFQQFSWTGGNAVFRDVGVSVLLYPSLIVAFMAVVVYEGFRSRRGATA
jgi:hypothetical protein